MQIMEFKTMNFNPSLSQKLFKTFNPYGISVEFMSTWTAE